VEGQYYHGRVVVERNTFDISPSPLLYALSVRELIWRDNQVRPTGDHTPLFDDPASRLINVGRTIIAPKSPVSPGLG